MSMLSGNNTSAPSYSVIVIKATDRTSNQADSIPVLYLGASKLNSWPGDQLSWLRFNMVFQSPSRQMSE
jgi:hypothetical protein